MSSLAIAPGPTKLSRGFQYLGGYATPVGAGIPHARTRYVRGPVVLLLAFLGACGGAADDVAAQNGALTSCATNPNAPGCSDSRPSMTAHHVADDAVVIDGVVDASWANAPAMTFDTAWSGAHTTTSTTVRTLWSEHALYMLWQLDGA